MFSDIMITERRNAMIIFIIIEVIRLILGFYLLLLLFRMLELQRLMSVHKKIKKGDEKKMNSGIDVFLIEKKYK